MTLDEWASCAAFLLHHKVPKVAILVNCRFGSVFPSLLKGEGLLIWGLLTGTFLVAKAGSRLSHCYIEFDEMPVSQRTGVTNRLMLIPKEGS